MLCYDCPNIQYVEINYGGELCSTADLRYDISEMQSKIFTCSGEAG